MAEKAAKEKEEEMEAQREYVKLSNQFVVPVVKNERVSSLVVLSLSVEVKAGTSQDMFSHEPKLRDLFLQALLIMQTLAVLRASSQVPAGWIFCVSLSAKSPNANFRIWSMIF